MVRFTLSHSCSPGNGAGAAVHVRAKEDRVPQETDFSRTPQIRRTTRSGATGILRTDVGVWWMPRAWLSSPVRHEHTYVVVLCKHLEGMDIWKYLNKLCPWIHFVSRQGKWLFGGKKICYHKHFVFNHRCWNVLKSADVCGSWWVRPCCWMTPRKPVCALAITAQKSARRS